MRSPASQKDRFTGIGAKNVGSWFGFPEVELSHRYRPRSRQARTEGLHHRELVFRLVVRTRRSTEISDRGKGYARRHELLPAILLCDRDHHGCVFVHIHDGGPDEISDKGPTPRIRKLNRPCALDRASFGKNSSMKI